MNSNIAIGNVSKHLYRNNADDGNVIKSYQTKFVDYNFFSINEAKNSDRIKNILYYSNHFLVIDEYEFIDINNLNKTYLERVNVDNNKYLVFKYANDKYLQFYNFLFNICNSKQFTYTIITSFSYILKGLILLNDNNICFFDFSPKNIVFHLRYREKPMLQDFELSLHVLKLNEKYITKIISKIDNYIHKPLEVHILFYIIQNDIQSLSYSLIIEIVEKFVKNLHILTLFSDSFQNSYKQKCIESLKQYINVPKTNIIENILEHHNKWDVYSLSIIYLHIFEHVVKHFSLRQTSLNKISNILLKYIEPDPINRGTLEQLLYDYEKIFDNADWKFVNKLSSANMKVLLHNLIQ